jgi:hypothetical protein
VPEVVWLTGFLDLPADTFEVGARFWAAATGTGLSTRRGEHGQFATLLPDGADACWRVQRLASGGPSMHLDLHGDMSLLERDLVARGATVVERFDDVVVLRSPGGLPFCVVAADSLGSLRSERSERLEGPAPVDWGTHTSMLDQVCLDVPASSLQEEIAFWSATLDADASPSVRRPEFTNLRRPDHLPPRLPLRLICQEVGPFETPRSSAPQGPDRSVTAHPDLATTDRQAEVTRLVALGATVVVVEQFWTVLEAPDARYFCVTERDPSTGQLN